MSDEIPFPLATTTDKFQAGISKVGEHAVGFEIRDFFAVMDREWTADVHFVCYAPIEPKATKVSSDPWPRIKKEALQSIRELGGDVVLTCIALDMDLKDNPKLCGGDTDIDEEGKPVWTTEKLKLFLGAQPELHKALATKGLAGATVTYTTTHGARFVHRLQKPVPVGEEAENAIRGLIAVYAHDDIGVVLDAKCTDWTRVFRAPKVLRGGTPTWKQRWFSMRFEQTYLLNAAAINPVTRAAHSDRYAELRIIDRGQPTPELAYERLYVVAADGKQQRTQKHKFAQKILAGTDCYPILFEDLPIADEGHRDDKLLRLVGSAVSRLMEARKEFEPEDVYALFLPSVEQLRPDAGTPDWTASLWGKIKTCWQKEDAKRRAQEQLREEAREQAATKDLKLLALLRETCEMPELHSEDPGVALAALDSLKLIVTPDGRVRCLTPVGYSKLALPQQNVPMLVRQCKADDVIQLTHINKQGDEVPTRADQILSRYGSAVNSVEGHAGAKTTTLHGCHRTDLHLIESLYRRHPNLGSEFSQAVDDWLRELVGEDRITELNRWIAWALAFEEGAIAALSFAGPPGAGKGMFVRGLVETLENPSWATSRDLTEEKNPGLKLSPFLVVDEGLPRRGPGGKDIADTFRSLTAGEAQWVDEKYRALVKVSNPMRVVFTANNTDVVRQLANRTLTEDDLGALAIRILHFDVRREASEHLSSRGGMAYTRGWVDSAAGGGSEFVLARHFLWLYDNREQYPRSNRLLVEGSADSSLLQEMRTAEQGAEYVACLMVRIIEGHRTLTPLAKRGVSFEDGHVYVSSSAIHEVDQADLGTRKNLTLASIGCALKNLSRNQSSERANRKALDGKFYRLRWVEVDLSHLHRFASTHGLPSTTIQEMLLEAAENR